MPDIRPELIEKAAKELARKWCLREGHAWDSETWELLPLDTILRFRADATDALLSIADDLRVEGAAQALREAAGGLKAHRLDPDTQADQSFNDGIENARALLRGRADQIEARADQQPESELDAAWQSRDWDTVKRLIDEGRADQ